MIFETTVKNPKKTHYFGEDHDERIEYLFRKSTITLIPSVIFFILLFLLPIFLSPILSRALNLQAHTEMSMVYTIFFISWYVFCFAYLFHAFVLWYFNVYLVTNKKILDVDFEGLLYTNVSEASLDRIEDVTSQVKGLVNTLLHIGNVYIQTAGESAQFDFLMVEDPSSIRDIIADKVSSYKRGRHD
jgi:uncharacterized membrane protein YdbT with pleckstrin-like domain